MPSAEMTARFKADISQLKAQMQAAQRQVKLVNSEFKAATAGMDDWTKSEEGLTAKIKQLNGTLDAQKKKLALMNDELEKTIAVYGEESAAADRVRVAINNQQAAIAKTEKDLKSYNNQLEELPKTMDDVGDAAEKASDGFTVFKGALADLLADGVRNVISGLKDLAQEAIQVGMDFESAMSQVGAVSGASAEDMELLTAKAEEMGEKTKFSATESAEAFNYMAMAGWKTEDMLDGIEGIMNLAAASGADLATTSDIVTDALTAMGYEAKDAGRLADVMAAASSNANTNVELMGSTFQYAAPLVGALGYSMEDTAVAIGLMANAGIKGEKAGTALRSMFNRLSAPPKQCAEEMEKLGISLTDNDGKMKDLNTVITELRIKFANLSETEATAAAKHIAGAEAMSGLLAIVNATDQDFQKLTVAVNESSGAAEKMAEIMQDNVSGQFTLLQSKIQGIMIRLFKQGSDSMKNGIKTVGDALDKVNWNKVGDEIGKFATKAADFFAYLVRNSSTIISVLKTIGTLIASAFIASKVSSFATAFTGLVGAFKAAQSATEAMTLASEALGISMSAIPIFAVVAGLGLLYSAYKADKAAMEEDAQAAYGLTESQNALIDSINETSDALARSSEARKDEGENIDFAYGKISDLKDQYNSLIDENGRVKEGSEDLANVLLNQLAEGLGTTVDKLKENIDANGQLSQSIDDLIEKKKVEAKLAAYEDDYNQALKDEVESWNQVKDAQKAAADKQKEVNELQEKYNNAVALTKDMTSTGILGWKRLRDEEKAKAELDAATEALGELNQAVEETQNNWETSQSTIKNYQEALAASTEGNTERMNNALFKIQGGIKNNTVVGREELEQQYLDTKNGLSDIQELYDQGLATDEMLNSYKQINEAAGAELDAWVAKNQEAGAEGVEGFASSASEQLGRAYDVAEQLGSGSNTYLLNGLGDWGGIAEDRTGDFLGILDGKKKDFNKGGEDSGKETAEGIESTKPEFIRAAEAVTDEFNGQIDASKKTFTDSGNFMSTSTAEGAEDKKDELKAPGEHVVKTFSDTIKENASQANEAGGTLASEAAAGADSHAGDAETSGQNFAQGFINGIGKLFKAAFDKAKELAGEALSGLKKGQQEGSPSKLTTQSGKFFGEGYAKGIKSTTKLVTSEASKVGKAAVKSLKKAQKEGSPSKLTYESGRNFTQGYINGIASMQSQLVATTKSLVTSCMKELLKLENFNFDDVSESASSKLSAELDKKLSYITDRMQYENEQKIKDFENTIAQLQEAQKNATESLSASNKAEVDKLTKEYNSSVSVIKSHSEDAQKAINNQIEYYSKQKQTKEVKETIKSLKAQLKAEKEALKKRLAAAEESYKKQKDALSNSLTQSTEDLEKSYEQQIKEQEDMKEAYQQASSSMISEFTKAMQEYQSAAQKLIDDTMNAITDKYNKRYDALLNKQDNLIDKLKSAGDLFSLSGANVMTINDINAQTAAIKQYAAKLSKIKERVSSDLFDEIASYDMKEGEAFIDRLLSMSDRELQAYSDAYDEKMSVSESLSKNIYKKDFDKVASDYEKAVQDAFKDLPGELEELGMQTMQGFLSGLTTNTEYMESAVRTFVSGIIDQFKSQLGIASPSKVTMKLGELVGEGFADGILDMVNAVKDAAKEITDAVTDNLSLDQSLSGAKSAIYTATGAAGLNRNAGSFMGDRTQIINFNQVNNSPKALDRLTLYRQTNNMLFSAKVGLSNV